jgi:molybdopterin-guanine dinucleotide biosynthesis protein A
MSGLAAVVVAGGGARRLGGASKPDLIIGDETLLDPTLGACATAQAAPVVVVGPDALARDGIHITQESPAGSGPAAGLIAGLEAAEDLVSRGDHRGGDLGSAGPSLDYVLALACDMPNAADAVPALMEATADRVGVDEADSDGAWLVDDTGRSQPLLAIYRVEALTNAARALPSLTGVSMKQLTLKLTMTPVLGLHHASDDVDTWKDADRWGARPWPSRQRDES